MREKANPALSELTTLRLGGKAIAMLELESMADVEKLPQRLAELGGEAFFLGRGSNILALDGDLPLVLVKAAFAPKFTLWPLSAQKARVQAGAGQSLAGLLRFCMQNGLSGLEGLTGIPGSVGGACAMNAGSFGASAGDCLGEILVYADGEIKSIKSNELSFAYRSMKLAGGGKCPLILEAIFDLTRAPKRVISRDMSLNFIQKKSRQPLAAWSAGCAFKNPAYGPSAGELLDKAGFRGKKLGGMAFSQKHANFLINEGKGKAGAAIELLEMAKMGVKERFGVELELEIRIIPWPWP